MKVDKIGRSFVVKNNNVSVIQGTTPVKNDTQEELIAGIHKSGTRTIKELALIYRLTEDEVEKIVSTNR